MITLKVEEMCHECPNFNAVSETSVLYGNFEIIAVDSVIKCASQSMCKHTRQYLKTAVDTKRKPPTLEGASEA